MTTQGGLDFALQFGASGNSAVTTHCATQGQTHCGSLTGFAERLDLADAPREGAVEVIGDHPSSNMVAVAHPIGPTQNIVGQVTAQITAQFAPLPSGQGLSQPLGSSKHGDGAGFSARPNDAAGGGHLTEHTQGTHGGGRWRPHISSRTQSQVWKRRLTACRSPIGPPLRLGAERSPLFRPTGAQRIPQGV